MAKSGSQTQRERREQGKCCSCNSPIWRGSRCEEHWHIAKAQAAARYEARKAVGLCGMCGNQLKTDGYDTCLDCREKQNKARRVDPATKHVPFDKPFHQRNKEAGYCTLGGAKHERPQDGYTLCTACLEKKRKHTKANRTTINAYNRKQYAEKKEAGYCVIPGCHNGAMYGKMCGSHRYEAREKDTRKRQRLRDEAFAQYGGYRCNCAGCTTTTPEFLQLDHVNNDGAEHRRTIAGSNTDCGGNRMYYWLKKNGWPKIVQPMCANCNLAKGKYSACPLSGQSH